MSNKIRVHLVNSVKFHPTHNLHAISNVLDRIRTGHKHKNIILKARSFSKGTKEYKIEKDKLPVWLPNAIFSGTFKDEDAKSLTGFIYFDADLNCREEAETLKNSLIGTDRIKSVWLSVSETGIGALIDVRDRDFTLENFNAQYEAIIQELGLMEFYDQQCNSFSRKNYLSYDNDIWIDDEFNNPEPEEDYEENRILFGNVFPKSEFAEGQKLIIIDEGYECPNFFIPKQKIVNGKRGKALYSFCSNVVKKNGISDTNHELIVRFLMSWNDKACYEPKTENEIRKIVDSVRKRYEAGTLRSNSSKRKKAKWVVGNGLSGQEKIKMYHNQIKQNKIDAINRVLACNPNLSHKEISELTSISIRFIRKQMSGCTLQLDGTSNNTISRCNLTTNRQKSNILKKEQTRKLITDAISGIGCLPKQSDLAMKTGLSIRTIKSNWHWIKEWNFTSEVEEQKPIPNYNNTEKNSIFVPDLTNEKRYYNQITLDNNETGKHTTTRQSEFVE